MAAARRRMGAHASVAPRAELLAARIRIDLELAAQASFRAVFMSDMGQTRHFDRAPITSVLPRWSQPVDATLYLEGEMECGLMGHRFHRGFTAAEKTELWDRCKRGESLKAVS